MSQDEPQFERYVRQPDGRWLLTVFKGLESVLDMQGMGTVPLAEIYDDVDFDPEETLRPVYVT